LGAGGTAARGAGGDGSGAGGFGRVGTSSLPGGSGARGAEALIAGLSPAAKAEGLGSVAFFTKPAKSGI